MSGLVLVLMLHADLDRFMACGIIFANGNRRVNIWCAFMPSYVFQLHVPFLLLVFETMKLTMGYTSLSGSLTGGFSCK